MSNRVAIIGGGISGLTVAYQLRKRLPDTEIVVLEQEDTPGGKVQTSIADGYTVEWGPNGFLTNVTDTLDLALELGLEDDLLVAADAAKKRYVFRDGSLRPLPTGPAGLLGTELLSPVGRIRAALEPLLARRHEPDDDAPEETVHDFIARHFGSEVARNFSEVLVLGIAAGDPNQLSIDALFLRLRELEHEHRSVLLGMIASQRAVRETARRASRLTSFRRGTAQLTDALASALGRSVRTGVRVMALRRSERGSFLLELDEGEDLHADAAVLAVPAYAAAPLVASWAPIAAEKLDEIAFAPIRVFGLGYDRVDVPRVLDGFGFLAPRDDGLRSLGVLWSSTVFPDHAPPGKVLLRVLAGGVRDPAFATLDRDEALDAVRKDLSIGMGITAEPEFVERVDWPRGIPQYRTGHVALVAEIERALAQPGSAPLELTGNSYRGIGLNDCVRDAYRTADAVAESLA
jgi:oxygen-dependent protoporphyrinogen oxidase